jgi:hypothetical protein
MEWVRHGANEELDIAVGARALAYHLGVDRLTAEEWTRIAAQRGAAPVEGMTLFDAPISTRPTATVSEPPSAEAGERRSPVVIDPVEPEAPKRAPKRWLAPARSGAWLKRK